MQISLSNRNLADFDASAFSTREEREMLYKISKLDVSHNRLTLVRGMQCLTNLTTLDVSSNIIRSLAGLPLKVRRLNVANNDLQTLEGLAALTQLEWLDVSRNDLTSLIGLPATPALRHVEAANNKLSSVKGIELTPSLHFLGVANNIIRRVEDINALRHLRALKQLDLTNNPVTATGRNTAAIRMAVPKITIIEGIVLSGGSGPSPHRDLSSVLLGSDQQQSYPHNLKETSQIIVGAGGPAHRRSSSANAAAGGGATRSSSQQRGRSPVGTGVGPAGAGARGGGSSTLRSSNTPTSSSPIAYRRAHSADRHVHVVAGGGGGSTNASAIFGGSQPVSPIRRRGSSNEPTPNTSSAAVLAGLQPAGSSQSSSSGAGGIRGAVNAAKDSKQPSNTPRGPTIPSSASARSAPHVQPPQMMPVSVSGGPSLKGVRSTYESLLRDLEMSKIRTMRGGVGGGATTSSSSTRERSPRDRDKVKTGGSDTKRHQSAGSSATDRHARARSAEDLRRNTLAVARHLDTQSLAIGGMRTGVTTATNSSTIDRDARITAAVNSSYNGRMPTSSSSTALDKSMMAIGRDGTYEKDLLNVSQPSYELHRIFEQRIAALEKELAFTKRKLSDKTAECDTAHLQVKQLKETIDRQSRVNAVLADTNRSLSVSAVHHQHQMQHQNACLLSTSKSRTTSDEKRNVGSDVLNNGENDDEISKSPSSGSKKREGSKERRSREKEQVGGEDGNYVGGRRAESREKTSRSHQSDQREASDRAPAQRLATIPNNTVNAAYDSQGYTYQQQVKPEHRHRLGLDSGKDRQKENLYDVYSSAPAHRHSAKEPKRTSQNVSVLQPSNSHQSMAPIGFAGNGSVRNAYVDPTASNRSPPQHQRTSSANNSRNVSFGGSLFYSPPTHYTSHTP